MNELAKNYDVIIIGAGPAGLTAALALHNSSLRVLLLEKNHHSSEKICGGALAPYIPKVFNTINPEFAEAFYQWKHKLPVNICRVSSNLKNVHDFIFPQTGWICRREDFDEFLMSLVASISNITIKTGQQVNKVCVQPDYITAQTTKGDTYNASILIACDGRNSVARKQLMQRSIDRQHHATAVRAYFSGVADLQNNTFEIHFLRELIPGYFWIFPVSNQLTNVGIGLPTTTIIQKKISMSRLLQQLIHEQPVLSRRFRNARLESAIAGAGLPLGMHKMPISGHRFMLCGDAASLIDPLSGEGIGQAMVSGRYAGWHAALCCQQQIFNSEFMHKYDDAVYNKLLKTNLRHAQVMKKIEQYPFLVPAGLFLAKYSKPFYRRVIRHFEAI